jgi:hypothetical protein
MSAFEQISFIPERVTRSSSRCLCFLTQQGGWTFDSFQLIAGLGSWGGLVPASHEFQVVGRCRKHAGPHIRGGCNQRQVCKACQKVQLAQDASHRLPDFAEGLCNCHHLHIRGIRQQQLQPRLALLSAKNTANICAGTFRSTGPDFSHELSLKNIQ